MEALKRFRGWLRVAPGGSGGNETLHSLLQARRVIEQWTDSPKELLEELDSIHPIELPAVEFNVQPARGFITLFPVFSALWAQPRTVEEVEKGRCAQAGLIHSTWLLSRRLGGIAHRQATLSRAGLSVRRILARQHTPAGYWTIPMPGSLAAFASSLQELLQHTPANDLEVNLVRGLLALLNDALQDRPPRLRAAGQRQRSSAQVGSLGWEIDDPVSPHLIFEEQRWQPSAQVQEAAAAVAETTFPQLIAIKGSAGEDLLTPAQQIRRARFRSEAIACTNQGVMQASDRLQLVDLAGLDLAAEALLSRVSWIPEGVSLQAVGAVFLSLLTGRNVAELANTKVSTGEAAQAGGRGLSLDLESRTIWVPGPELPKAFQASSSDAGLYRSISKRYTLSLPPIRFSEAMLTCLSGRSASASAHDGRHFPLREGHQLQLEMDRFLQHVNRKFRARTTAARVAQFLRRQVFVATNDWADAALLSGQRGALDPRLYYYAPRATRLEDIYQEVWEGVGRGLGPDSAQCLARSTANDQNTCIGSQGVPEDEAVQEMVRMQMQIVRGARTGRPNLDRLRHGHNALTTYTLLFVMWHTGVRAVDDLVDLKQYDPASGFLGVSDKDGNDYADARVVWLPDLAQRQVQAYRRCAVDMSTDRPLDFELDGSLFYLSEGWTRQALTLSNVRHYLTRYPFRLNAQRHYLRTRLRELGVSGQSVDALLGHGSRGQEPYAQYSAYTPTQLRSEVGPALETLCRNAGWAVIPSA